MQVIVENDSACGLYFDDTCCGSDGLGKWGAASLWGGAVPAEIPMLVLARQRDETIMIGDQIEVTVVDIRGDKVRLGINAPKTIAVHRKEVYDAIRRENLSAAQMRPEDLTSSAPRNPTVMKLHKPELTNADAEMHAPFIAAAIEEAKVGLGEGGLPIGSVLVRNNQIIGRGHNRRVQRGDPMAHAEIDCLTNAGRQKTYKDTILYSTLMPCFLCSGATVQFGVPRVVVGESVNFHGAPELLRSKHIEVIDLHDSRCIQLMSDFIQAHPDLWREDIGK
jgi:cytosine/creatinine deaminase